MEREERETLTERAYEQKTERQRTSKPEREMKRTTPIHIGLKAFTCVLRTIDARFGRCQGLAAVSMEFD